MPKKKAQNKGIIPNVLLNEAFGPIGNINTHRTRACGPIVAQTRKSKRNKPRRPANTKPDHCPCKNFKVADLYWQQHQLELRPVWNAAVKRPRLSGYELWMKESLYSLHSFGTLPTVPSVSGGYTLTHVSLDATHFCEPGEPYIGKAPCGPWLCSGHPDYLCSLAWQGNYATAEACAAACVGLKPDCRVDCGDMGTWAYTAISGLTLPPGGTWDGVFSGKQDDVLHPCQWAHGYGEEFLYDQWGNWLWTSDITCLDKDWRRGITAIIFGDNLGPFDPPVEYDSLYIFERSPADESPFQVYTLDSTTPPGNPMGFPDTLSVSAAPP